ncbi:MAG: ABC transporter substrate-binding protein, partial [Verrucomicrobiota bacterium]
MDFRIAQASFLSFCLIILTSCQQAPPSLDLKEYPLPKDVESVSTRDVDTGGIFIRAELGELATLNPMVAEDRSSSNAIKLMLGSLVEYNWVTEESIPGLAKSWTISEDGKTFTFSLREGLRWSDGHLFDADDVLFSYQAYMDERFPNRGRFQLLIDGQFPKFEKIDDLTVRIISPKIYAPFLIFICGMEIMPEHILRPAFEDGTLLKAWSIGTAKNNPNMIVGTGPYLLESYKPGERIVFVRNPNYYKVDQDGNRLPYMDRIISHIFRDVRTQTIAFSRGLTDAESIQPTDLGWVQMSSEKFDFKILERGPAPSTSFIWFNLNPGKNKDGKPFVDPKKLAWFQDVRFRRAVSYGVNRKGIIDGVLFGRGVELVSMTSPANKKWFNPNVRRYPYDPEKARSLLIEAGFRYDNQGKLFDTTGNRVSFKLETNKESNTRTDMATVFKENMAELGIEVELRFVDFNSFIVSISDSFEYEAGLLGFGGGVSDPHAGKDIYMSGGRLHQWYPEQPTPATPWEAEIDKLMIEQGSTLDFTKRKAAFDRVQALIAEHVPVIPLVTPMGYVG